MDIRYYKEPSLQKDYVEVHYQEESETVEAIRGFFDSFQSILAKTEEGMIKLLPSSIYYLEVVDRRLFAYQEKKVCQVNYSMRQFMECFEGSGVVQIGKSTIVNLYKVDCVKTDLNMKLRLHMSNGEVVMLNRAYKKAFLTALAKIQEGNYENHR